MPEFQPAPVRPEIALAEFERLDIRVGTIRKVCEVPDADRLVQLLVSFGDHQRSIVAGIKQERVDPGELVGRQTLFVINLPSRKMRGVMSEGMLLDLGFADGILPALSVPERPLPDGTRAG